jgi:hypothetical protein
MRREMLGESLEFTLYLGFGRHGRCDLCKDTYAKLVANMYV